MPAFDGSGKALYGIRPASEEAIRAYHAPRKALPPPDDFEDEPRSDDVCAFCAEPLGQEDVERVETGPDGEVEVWHRRCAVAQAETAAQIDGARDSGGVA